jgi:hypothetical protein
MTMRVTYLPVLAILRELYVQPRDMQRFQRYIATLTGGSGDVVLPIGVANPMAKEHAVVKMDELLAIGADEIGADAAAEADARLRQIEKDVEIKASVVLVDDVAGGWTNRYTSEASVRFPGRGALKRPFATALAWTSESPTADDIRRDMLAAIYRVAYQQWRGLSTSLAAMLNQEGLAGVFAGAGLTLSAAQISAARAVIETLGKNPPYPTVFAAMYGDGAAEQLGYPVLGLPARAGFEVALADALKVRHDPVAALSLGTQW